jgi:hypothetical protein
LREYGVIVIDRRGCSPVAIIPAETLQGFVAEESTTGGVSPRAIANGISGLSS